MTHFEEAIELQINENLQANEELKKQADPVWTDPAPITEKLSGVKKNGIKATGVYKIYHIDNPDEPMVIGDGVITDRKSKHVYIFKNKGNAKTYPSGTSCACATAQKMYEYDDTLENWLFSWCKLPKTISTKYETVLIKKLKPEFNLQSMAGL